MLASAHAHRIRDGHCRCLHAHQPGILAILHVADQFSVVDQHVIGRGRAFVVDMIEPRA